MGITLVHFLSKWLPNKNTFKRSRSSSSPLGPTIWTEVGRSQKHRHSTIPIVFVSDMCPYRIHRGQFCMCVLSMLGKYFFIWNFSFNLRCLLRKVSDGWRWTFGIISQVLTKWVMVWDASSHNSERWTDTIFHSNNSSLMNALNEERMIAVTCSL